MRIEGISDLTATGGSRNRVLERLAPRRRLVPPAEDTGRLRVAGLLRARVRAFAGALREVQGDISLVTTASLGIAEIESTLTQARNLAASAAEAAPEDQPSLQQSLDEKLAQISKTVSRSTLEGRNLLAGSLASNQVVTIPDGTASGFTLQVEFGDLSPAGLGLGDLEIGDDSTLTRLDAARSRLRQARARIDRLALFQERRATVLRAGAGSLPRGLDTAGADPATQRTREQILADATLSLRAQAHVTPTAAIKSLS